MSEIKFLSIGNKITLLVNGEEGITNQWYPYNSVFQFRNKTNFKGEPFDKAKYVYRNEGKQSNEAEIIINFPPDKNNQPSSYDKEVYLENNKEYDLISFINHNNSVDRIKIVDFDPIGELSLNGSNIYKGQVVSMDNFSNIKFNTKNGIGVPYNTIRFQVGNSSSYSNVYSIETNINGYASFEKEDIKETINQEQNQVYYTVSNKILNGVVNGLAKFKVIIESNSTEIFNNELNTSVVINDKEIINPGEYEFDINLDENGECNLEVEVSSTSLISGGGVYFVIEVLSINENENIVQGNKKNNFLINL